MTLPCSRKTQIASAAISALGLLAIVPFACRLNVDVGGATFKCATDDDCGKGYVCRPQRGRDVGFCFKEGACRDSETCNGEDDDCNGAVDEDFDFQRDDDNCGACGRVCSSGSHCEAGRCAEDACADGLDNDADLNADCVDLDCAGKSCGTGCVCQKRTKTEANCQNSVDDDGDGPADCLDSDCAGQACDTATPSILNCGRTVATDGGPGDAGPDAGADDAGPADAGVPDATVDDGGAADASTVDAGGADAAVDDGGVSDASTVDAGAPDAAPFDGGDTDAGDAGNPYCVPREAVCDNGIDDDGDSATDCADPDCNGQACAPDKTCANGACL